MLGVGTAGPVAPPPGRGERDPHDARDPGSGATPAGTATAEREAWTILAAIDGLGPVAFASLLARYGSGRAILAAAAEPGAVERLSATPPAGGRDVRERQPVTPPLAVAIVAALDTGPALIGRLRDLDILAVTVEEPRYPARLAGIAMPPHVLFVRGDPDALGRDRSVAIVGTRRATTGGRTTAGRIASALVAAEATVVSGLAYGIDGAAHEATIRAGGVTVAVIGGGHARAIPRGHRRLADAIVRSGGAVVSELGPDVEPTRGTFPRRNRIISGLAAATVVVEAPARSGALLTASWALEQGRECFLVPGAIDAPASAGCLSFLRDWPELARLVAGVPQLIADLGYADGAGMATGLPDPAATAALGELGLAASRVAGALVAGRVTVDELVAVTDLPVASVLASLTLLERDGLAVGVHGRYRPAGPLLRAPAPSRPR